MPTLSVGGVTFDMWLVGGLRNNGDTAMVRFDGLSLAERRHDRLRSGAASHHDLLPDREAATVAAWLAARPSIGVIARDRGAGYIQAATDGRPEATQVADRWHLMENASAAFLTVVQRSMQAVRTGTEPR